MSVICNVDVFRLHNVIVNTKTDIVPTLAKTYRLKSNFYVKDKYLIGPKQERLSNFTLRYKLK